MSRVDGWVRRTLVGATVLGLAALAYGPTRYLVSEDHAAETSTMSLFDDPYAAPRLAPWPVGIADTAGGSTIPATGGRAAPVGQFLTLDEARARTPGTAYVAVTGTAAGHALPGVGAVLTPRDVAAVLDLDEPARTDTIRYLSAVDGAALGLFAMAGDPAGRAQVVTSRSRENRRRLLSTGDASVKGLIDLSAQQRPDLTVLVTPPGYDDSAALSDVGLPTSATATPATNATTTAYRSAVAQAAAREIFPELAQRREAVAPHLFTDPDADGLFVLGPDGVTTTARGAAYGVAALAAPPGSKVAPSRSTGGIRAMAFERPRGGASVLVWNPGPSRRVTVDLPYGDRIHRVRVMLAAEALTAVLLAR